MRNKKTFRRSIARFLMASILLPSLLMTPGSVLANHQDEPNKSLTQKEALEKLQNADDVREYFHLGAATDPLPDDFVEQWDLEDPSNIRIDVRWANRGFEARDDSDTQFKSEKFKGRPYVEWSNKDGQVGDFQKPGGKSVRYVLTQANLKTNNELDEAQLKVEGVIWIFRNEYNPSLAMINWHRKGIQQDHRRFVYTNSCEAVDDKKDSVFLANMAPWKNNDNAADLSDDPSSDETKKLVKDYKLETCKGDQGGFSLIEKGARAAISLLKDIITFFYEILQGWLVDIVDVGALSDNPGLIVAWKTIRDLVNIFFILILITVAFSNILRLDTERYGMRALLPRLIFAVIAVNFSFLFVQMLVNAAYILTQPFAASATDVIKNPPINGGLLDPEAGFGQFFVSFLALLAVVIAMAILVFFFIVRIIMVWLLTALSPFVFLFMVLPMTRSLASSWWKAALKWIFMAPISFVILYIAATLISEPAGDNADLGNVNFLLKVGFFVGAIIAAVIIPLQLGGQIMGAASKAGRRGGMFGGKAAAGAGMMAASKAKVGDTDLATRMRATGYGLGLTKPKSAAEGSRQAFKQEKALEHLGQQTASQKGVGRVTGATAGQRTIAAQKAIAAKQKEMATVTPAGKQRIAYAALSGNAEAGDVIRDENGNSLGTLTAEEADFSKSKFASQAAFAELAQANHVSEGLNEAYADSGLAQLNTQNPAMASIERNGNYRPESAASRVQNMSQKDVSDQQEEFWQHAVQARRAEQTGKKLTPYQQTVLHAARSYDAQQLAYASTTGERNSFTHSATRDSVRMFAADGGFQDARDDVVKDTYNKDNNEAEKALKTHGII